MCCMESVIDAKWLVFLAQLPAAPSSARVAAWRRLKAAGAVGLTNGAWLLPATKAHGALFAQLTDTVRLQGGNALVFAGQPVGAGERDDLVARFRSDRGREYDEFAGRATGLLAEIDRETAAGKFMFAELEEVEADFEKLTAWLDKIRARDFFPDEREAEAAALLTRCAAALRVFAASVYENEGAADRADAAPPRSAKRAQRPAGKRQRVLGRRRQDAAR